MNIILCDFCGKKIPDKDTPSCLSLKKFETGWYSMRKAPFVLRTVQLCQGCANEMEALINAQIDIGKKVLASLNGKT